MGNEENWRARDIHTERQKDFKLTGKGLFRDKTNVLEVVAVS